jgi:transposase
VEEKRRMVEQTLEAGASVARVAQENGVNPNLLFLWRRQHREGRLTASNAGPVRLLPVTVTDSPVQNESGASAGSAPSILVELPKGRVWIEAAHFAPRVLSSKRPSSVEPRRTESRTLRTRQRTESGGFFRMYIPGAEMKQPCSPH